MTQITLRRLLVPVALLFAVAPLIGAAQSTEVREVRDIERAVREVREVRDIRGATSLSGDAYVDGEVLVKYRGQSAVERVRLSGGETVAAALARLNAKSDIEYAEPDYIAHALYTPNDTFYRYQWHMDNAGTGGIGMEAAWDVSNGAGIVVAIIDTGVASENYMDPSGKRYYLAPDLAATSFVPGWDFVGNDAHPNDDHGHGTHVAGTVAQSTGNGSGVAGVAFGSSIMPLKVLNSSGSGTYSAIASAIRFAADNGAKVINLSLGGSSGSQTLKDALAYAYGKGVTIVAAAGNDGKGTLSYPAAYNEYVIAVGATRYDEQKASYSNYGVGLDLVAPGGQMCTNTSGACRTNDQNGDGYGDGVLQQTFSGTTNNFGYYFYQGTSMAAPHVAGVAALVIANGNATSPDAVRIALQSSAKDIGLAGWDELYGHGLVNAPAALAYDTTTEIPPPPPPAVEKANISITMSASGSSRLWRVAAEVVVAANGAPLSGASVNASWSGIFNATVSGTTNSSGKVTFRTPYFRSAGTETFTVTKISKNDTVYVLEGATSASITK